MLEAVALAITFLTARLPDAGPAWGLEDPEEAAIRSVVDLYFIGMREGDAESLKRAFHPDAMLYFVGEGNCLQGLTQAQWYAGQAESPHAPHRSGLHMRVTSIDRMGEAAVARVEVEDALMRVTDYLSLLKIEGDWKVVNKIFGRAPED
jgi:hypothetical protein